MYANDSGSIEEVLASRRASKPPLTDEQLAIIARQHGALIDELANQELERFATEVIKNPIPIRSEPLRKLQENNLLAETPDLFYGQTGNIAPAVFLYSRVRPRCFANARRRRWRSLGAHRSANAPSATGACTLDSVSGSSRAKTVP
jgi:hypothetical protein